MSVPNAIADVTKHLLDKIEKVTGFIYDPNSRKKEAEDQLIKRIKEKNLPPLEEAALISDSKKIIKHYKNQRDIFELALKNLTDRDIPNIDVDKVDEEWISRFFGSAKHVSSDEMKLIWAQILSKEFSEPGCIPKRLISILSMIEYEQAVLFTKVCKHTVYFDELGVPIIDLNSQNEFLLKEKMYYADFLNLESLGLVTLSGVSNYTLTIPIGQSTKFEKKCSFFDHTFVIKSKGKTEDTDKCIIPVGNIMFTDCGTALMKSFDIDYSNDTYRYIVDYFENQGFEVHEKNEYQNKTIKLKHSTYKASAGNGFDLSDIDDWEEIEILDTPEARRADFSLTISGDSMMPIYSDGDIVLVKAQPAVDIGETGIFVVNGNGYIKQNGGDRLISLNPDYDDIFFSEGDTVSCAGKVIGTV